MKQAMTALALCFLSGMAVHAQADAKLSETRTTLEKWVETKQLTARIRSDWQADKETIEQTTRMLERELKTVEDQFTKLNTNTVQADKERKEAEAQLKAAQDALAPAAQFATDFEAKLRSTVPKLPQPLQDILKPLLAKLPTDASTTKMKPTERVQVLVGILNELDKFNSAVTLFTEKRKNDNGSEVSVETVYVGLGAAYFVNEAGDFAGVGTPGSAGWEWTNKPDIAANVREVIRIYRNERPAKFVSLPATVK